MSEVEALLVQVEQSPETIVVISAELLAEINLIGQQAADLSVIADDIQNEVAGKLLKQATTLLNQVEEAATAANAPFNKVTKAIGVEKAKATKPLEAFKKGLKAALSDFALKREKERLEVERQAAIQRAKEQAEVDAINRSREEAARAVGAEAPAPLVVPSTGITAKPGVAATSHTKMTYKDVVVVVDPGAVPRQYCVPDVALIEAAFKRGEIVPEFHPFFRVDKTVNVSAK